MFEADDSEPKHKAAKSRDFSPMSIAELQSYIADLESEIARAEAAISMKEAHKSGINALFGGKNNL